MIANTFISLGILLSVLLFVVRIHSYFKKQHIFPLKIMTKIGTFYFVFVFTLYFFNFQRPFWFWLLSFTSLLVVPLFLFLLTKFHQQQFYSEFLRFLSLVILSMKRGQSFSHSLETSLALGTWKQGQLLGQIRDHVVFSQQEPVVKMGLFGQFIKQISSEFRTINGNQHLAIDRLCKFRKNLLERLNFRQKSRQIWSYFYYQLGILSVIYLLIFLFVAKEYGVIPFKKSFFLSFVFYLLGLLSTFLIGRGKKWSI